MSDSDFDDSPWPEPSWKLCRSCAREFFGRPTRCSHCYHSEEYRSALVAVGLLYGLTEAEVAEEAEEDLSRLYGFGPLGVAWMAKVEVRPLVVRRGCGFYVWRSGESELQTHRRRHPKELPGCREWFVVFEEQPDPLRIAGPYATKRAAQAALKRIRKAAG